MDKLHQSGSGGSAVPFMYVDPHADGSVWPRAAERQLRWWVNMRMICERLTRESLKFQHLIRWHANLTMSNVIDDAGDMELRIVGDNVATILGADFRRGARLAQLVEVSPEAQRQHVNEIAVRGQIAINRSEVHLSGARVFRATAVDFPVFQDTSSPVADRIVTLYDIASLTGGD